MKSKIINFFIKLLILFSIQTFMNRNIIAQQIHIKTPADMEGPFYPIERQADEDNDLTIVKKRNKRAKGMILNLSGIIINTNGKPQKDAVIEIWQTDSKGLYKHPNDRNEGKRDPDFQYWGKNITKENGKFFFITLIPGEYHPRPAHIHFNIWLKGKLILTSQMYIIKKTNNKNIDSTFSIVNELLKLHIIPTKSGEYKGFFKIVI